jgi:hypothetical protein
MFSNNNNNSNNNFSNNNTVYQTPTSHQVPQFNSFQPPAQPAQFQSKFSSQFNQFTSTFNNQFPGFGSDGFSTENFGFDSNQFNQFSNTNTDLFQTQNQFTNTFNNQFPGFGTNSFAPKSTFNKFNFANSIKLPVNFQRIEGTIYEENPNMQY